MQHLQTDNSEIYNQLQDVLVADDKLTALNRHDVLDPLCRIIVKHNLENIVGIRLLHNHNTITGKEMMLEQEEVDQEGQYCLTTVATEESTSGHQARANSWMLGENKVIPLEYSVDPVVIAQSGAAISNEDFLKEFYENLKALNAADILGPCVLNRSFYDERCPKEEGVMLVETTDEERRANVVRFKSNGQYEPEQLIQTVWMAVRSKANPEIIMGCTKGSCSPTCLVVIHCEKETDGTHTRSSDHRKTAHWKEHIKEPDMA